MNIESDGYISLLLNIQFPSNSLASIMKVLARSSRFIVMDCKYIQYTSLVFHFYCQSKLINFYSIYDFYLPGLLKLWIGRAKFTK